MMIKIRDISEFEASNVIPMLTTCLTRPQNGTSMSHKDLDLSYKDLADGKYPGLQWDMTSSGIYICRLVEIKNIEKRGVWEIAVSAQEEVYQSEFFESDYAGGPPSWKVPRHLIDPLIDQLQRISVDRWQVSIASKWITSDISAFNKWRTNGCKQSWLIAPHRINHLFEETGVFPREKGVMIRDLNGNLIAK